MNGAARIRPATLAEAALVARLHELCLGEAWQAESVGRLMALPGAFALLALEPARPRDTPVGFVLCVPSPPAVDLAAIGVLSGRRRAGVGGPLLDAAVEAARTGGFSAMLLEVADDNRAALALYRSRGFTRAGLRRGYYRRADGKRDAVVLRLPLRLGANSAD